MEGVEAVDSAHTLGTKELYRDTVETTVPALFAAEFTTTAGEYAAAFQSDRLPKEQLAFGHHHYERIVLAGISFHA